MVPKQLPDLRRLALPLEIVDPRRGAVVWQGVAERPLRENPTREQADRAISETVARLLADFPPGRR